MQCARTANIGMGSYPMAQAGACRRVERAGTAALVSPMMQQQGSKMLFAGSACASLHITPCLACLAWLTTTVIGLSRAGHGNGSVLNCHAVMISFTS